MAGTLSRVLVGFVLACLTAGLVLVLHVFTPADFAKAGAGTLSANMQNAVLLTLLAATHTAIFASAFTLIAAGVGEWMEIRALPYYLFAAVLITLLGFAAQFSSETAGQATILNNYALKAFLTAGFFSGLVYWVSAGRFAGIRGRRDSAATASTEEAKAKLPKIEIAERAGKTPDQTKPAAPARKTGDAQKATEPASASIAKKPETSVPTIKTSSAAGASSEKS